MSGILGASGCSNVPQEVIDLSYVIGEDLAAVHESHRTLVKQHFANIRQQRVDWVNNAWAPRFIEKWVSNGRLLDLAGGKVVYDEPTDAFVAPSRGRERAQLLRSVLLWSQEAVAEIDEKRAKLVGPIDKEEKDLLAAVDEAFARIFRGNAAVTAHLNSLRRVQSRQDDILKALDLKDLRVKINDSLAKASRRLETLQGDVKEFDDELQKAKPKMDKLKKKAGG